MSFAKIRPRRGTTTQWKSANPILAEGEMGVEVPSSGVGKGVVKVKFGDGVTAWNNLPYGIPVGLTTADIEDSVTSSSTDKVASANIAKYLSERIDNINESTNVSESGTDLDNYTNPGSYFFLSTYCPSNMPSDATFTNGWLVVLKDNTTKYIKQFLISLGKKDVNDYHIYVRTMISTNGWSTWRRIATIDDVNNVTPKSLGVIEGVNSIKLTKWFNYYSNEGARTRYVTIKFPCFFSNDMSAYPKDLVRITANMSVSSNESLHSGTATLQSIPISNAYQFINPDNIAIYQEGSATKDTTNKTCEIKLKITVGANGFIIVETSTQCEVTISQ